MPPANSPSDTRPSTPPPYVFPPSNDPLSTSRYLRQLEEAISTPVPDLALRLNLNADALDTSPETRASTDLARIESTTDDAWDGRTVLRLSRDDDRLAQNNEPEYALERSSREVPRRRPYSTEAEFQSLTNESRQRFMMQSHNQSLRSRLRENVHGQPAGIAQVSRDSYATSGGGPARQQLYDWAATRERTRGGSLSNEPREEYEQRQVTGATDSGDNDRETRRELERALRNYRMARNALRSGRNSGTDLGAVPTASALRAYWNEDSNDNSTAANNNTTGMESLARNSNTALQEFVEQHRLDRQRRHIDLARRHAELRLSQLESPGSSGTLHERRTSEAFMRVRNTIRYLSDLRHTSVQGGLELARSLGLDSLYESPEMNTPSDLPMTIESLPTPQYSSWLQPGMVWRGLQSTDREPNQPPPLASSLRRERQREYLRRAMIRRGLSDAGTTDGTSSAQQVHESAGVLLDAERYLSDLIQETNASRQWDGRGLNMSSYENPPGRWTRFERRSAWTDTNTGTSVPALVAGDPDHWPVVVTLHTVDLTTMTVSGTMSASQIPDKLATSNSSSAPVGTEGKSMESFFQGEIVDFRQHAFETEGRRYNYRVGGVDVDARYWARLGPFRREIERASAGMRGVGASAGGNAYSKTKPGVTGTGLGREELDAVELEAREAEADEIMARCLGSRRWIEEKLGGEWILMRWKEKCFVTPSSPTTPSSAANANSRTYTTTTATTNPSSSSAPSSTIHHHTSWGLTISGFYYIALNRMTGHIDGLYYDPGSQPYQALRMVPQGMRLDEGGKDEADGFGFGRGTGLGSTFGSGRGFGDSDRRDADQVVGVKKWFPAVEFR